MKEIKELLELANELKSKGEEGNFLAYNIENGKTHLYDEWDFAKAWAQRGGQVLVIDKEKVYNYKVKNEEEFDKYLKRQVWKERHDMMNRYGL